MMGFLARLGFLAATTAAVAAAAAAEPAYVPTSELAAALADGQSWNIIGADGKNGVVRFDRDGNGAIERPIRRPIRWSVDGDRFCMQMGFPLGTRCFQAISTATGFQGFTGDKPSVRFSR